MAHRDQKSAPTRTQRELPPDRMPTNAELLADLSPYGDKRARPRAVVRTSRRTRDFLLTAGTGTAVIVVAVVKLLGDSDAITITKLALTGAGLFCALAWYIFYGVMSRY